MNLSGLNLSKMNAFESTHNRFLSNSLFVEGIDQFTLTPLKKNPSSERPCKTGFLALKIATGSLCALGAIAALGKMYSFYSKPVEKPPEPQRLVSPWIPIAMTSAFPIFEISKTLFGMYKNKIRSHLADEFVASTNLHYERVFASKDPLDLTTLAQLDQKRCNLFDQLMMADTPIPPSILRSPWFNDLKKQHENYRLRIHDTIQELLEENQEALLTEGFIERFKKEYPHPELLLLREITKKYEKIEDFRKEHKKEHVPLFQTLGKQLEQNVRTIHDAFSCNLALKECLKQLGTKSLKQKIEDIGGHLCSLHDELSGDTLERVLDQDRKELDGYSKRLTTENLSIDEIERIEQEITSHFQDVVKEYDALNRFELNVDRLIFEGKGLKAFFIKKCLERCKQSLSECSRTRILPILRDTIKELTEISGDNRYEYLSSYPEFIRQVNRCMDDLKQLKVAAPLTKDLKNIYEFLNVLVENLLKSLSKIVCSNEHRAAFEDFNKIEGSLAQVNILFGCLKSFHRQLELFNQQSPPQIANRARLLAMARDFHRSLGKLELSSIQGLVESLQGVLNQCLSWNKLSLIEQLQYLKENHDSFSEENRMYALIYSLIYSDFETRASKIKEFTSQCQMDKFAPELIRSLTLDSMQFIKDLNSYNDEVLKSIQKWESSLYSYEQVVEAYNAYHQAIKSITLRCDFVFSFYRESRELAEKGQKINSKEKFFEFKDYLIQQKTILAGFYENKESLAIQKKLLILQAKREMIQTILKHECSSAQFLNFFIRNSQETIEQFTERLREAVDNAEGAIPQLTSSPEDTHQKTMMLKAFEILDAHLGEESTLAEVEAEVSYLKDLIRCFEHSCSENSLQKIVEYSDPPSCSSPKAKIKEVIQGLLDLSLSKNYFYFFMGTRLLQKVQEKLNCCFNDSERLFEKRWKFFDHFNFLILQYLLSRSSGYALEGDFSSFLNLAEIPHGEIVQKLLCYMALGEHPYASDITQHASDITQHANDITQYANSMKDAEKKKAILEFLSDPSLKNFGNLLGQKEIKVNKRKLPPYKRINTKRRKFLRDIKESRRRLLWGCNYPFITWIKHDKRNTLKDLHVLSKVHKNWMKINWIYSEYRLLACKSRESISQDDAIHSFLFEPEFTFDQLTPENMGSFLDKLKLRTKELQKELGEGDCDITGFYFLKLKDAYLSQRPILEDKLQDCYVRFRKYRRRISVFIKNNDVREDALKRIAQSLDQYIRLRLENINRCYNKTNDSFLRFYDKHAKELDRRISNELRRHFANRS